MLSQIKEAQRTRLLQRAARKRQSGLEGKSLATIAVVGYTNAVSALILRNLSHDLTVFNVLPNLFFSCLLGKIDIDKCFNKDCSLLQ